MDVASGTEVANVTTKSVASRSMYAAVHPGVAPGRLCPFRRSN